jgi:hypothetical protein
MLGFLNLYRAVCSDESIYNTMCAKPEGHMQHNATLIPKLHMPLTSSSTNLPLTLAPFRRCGASEY